MHGLYLRAIAVFTDFLCEARHRAVTCAALVCWVEVAQAMTTHGLLNVAHAEVLELSGCCCGPKFWGWRHKERSTLFCTWIDIFDILLNVGHVNHVKLRNVD